MIGRAMVLALAVGAGVDGPGLRRVPYDAATPPRLSCSARAGCEVVLQPGERMTFAAAVDDRWSVVPADDGASGMAPRVLLRPAAADEPDGRGGRRRLRSWLTVLTTRREYVIGLEASSADQYHRLGFTYRENAGAAVRSAAPTSAPSASVIAPLGGEVVSREAVDVAWSATGDPAVRCAKPPFSIGKQVWCELPGATPVMPAAFAIDGRRLVPVPFHVADGRYLVVDALVSPIELVVGGSPRQTAIITRVVK